MGEAALAGALVENQQSPAAPEIARDDPSPRDHPIRTCLKAKLTQPSDAGTADRKNHEVDYCPCSPTLNLAHQRLAGPFATTQGH